MKQKLKRFTGILFSLALVLVLMPWMSLTAFADADDVEDYPLWIGGVQVNANNCSKLPDNHWSYDPSAHILALSGYTYSGEGYNYSGNYYAGIYYNGTDALTVSLTGTNSVTQTKHWGDPGDCPIVIDSTEALTVTGSGSLEVQQGDAWNYGPAILSSGDITFNGGTVKAVGGYYNGIKASSVTIKSTITSVDLKGSGDSAKAVDGTLINEIAGIGYNQWNQPFSIAANMDGASLTYKQVVFPIAQYTLRFDANGGSGSMDDVTVEEGESYELPSCGFDPPDGKKFNYWDVHGVDLIGTPGMPVVITSGCKDENGFVPLMAKWIDADKVPAATIKTAPEAKDLTYSGKGQALVTAGEAEGGAIWYTIGENETDVPDSGWSKDIPEGTSTRSYYVWYKAVGDNSHRDSGAVCCKAKINKANAVAATVTANNRTYDGTEMPLVTVKGEPTGGEMQYALGTDAATASTTGYSTSIPAKTDAGTYYVWYKAKGDGNHNDSGPGCVTAVIRKKKLTITAADQRYVYNGKIQGEGDTAYEDPAQIAERVTVKGLEGSDVLTSIIIDGQRLDAGEYPEMIVPSGATVGEETANYDITCIPGKLTIDPRDVTVKAQDQTVLEGQSIDTGAGMAALSDALSEHVLGTVTLKEQEGKIVPSAAVILDAEGNDVTDNYSISYQPGILTVIPKISRKVTFKVKNGSWNDGTAEDKEVTLSGYAGDSLKLRAEDIPAVGREPDEGYKKGSWDPGPAAGKVITENIVYIYTYEAEEEPATEPEETEPPETEAPETNTPEPETEEQDDPEEEEVPVRGRLLVKMTAKGRRGLKLTWKKVKDAEGYDIFFGRCSHGSRKHTCRKIKTIKGNKTFKWVKKGLKKNTSYKAYVRAWVKKSGKKIYISTSPLVHAYTSGWSGIYTVPKSIKLKKTRISLTAGQTYQIKAKIRKLKKGKKLMPSSHARRLRYMSSDKSVAAVSTSGRITARAKGRCRIYVYAANGVRKTIKLRVK